MQSLEQKVVVEATGIKKTFQNTGESLEILKGIDLTVHPGEMIAIMGESGSGKSTLLHILAALDHPTEGSVFLEGTDVYRLNAPDVAEFRRHSIGFIFQFHNLLPEFTALENVLMPQLIAGQTVDKNLGKELLAMVGLSERAGHRPGQLSGGEQQRVAIARSLVNNPALVLADEPTGSLDNHTGEKVFELFRKIQQEKNLTSILATHNANIALRCNRVFRLENGFLHAVNQAYV